MGKTIVFVHGAWMTSLCWEKFTGFFESKGYKCLAPAWPYRDHPIESLRKNPPPELARLGVGQIVDHYAKLIRELDEPPVLVGHSFGGLFVQMLLDRGLGAAAIALDPAPPKGVLPFFYPSAVRANLPVLLTPLFWQRILRQSFKAFQYAFVNGMPETEQKAVYDRYVVPETGLIFFQTATALLHNIVRVNFRNNQRGPLLLIAGEADNICPAAQIKVNFERYKDSTAVTDFKTFANRAHWLIGQPGWEEIAAYIDQWLGQLPDRK